MLAKYLSVFFISMVPLIELRGAIPVGVAMGLPLWQVYVIAIIGNMLPVPFIFFFARKVLEWGADKPVIGKFFTFCLEKGHKGGAKLKATAGRGLPWALLLFVGGYLICSIMVCFTALIMCGRLTRSRISIQMCESVVPIVRVRIVASVSSARCLLASSGAADSITSCASAKAVTACCRICSAQAICLSLPVSAGRPASALRVAACAERHAGQSSRLSFSMYASRAEWLPLKLRVSL